MPNDSKKAGLAAFLLLTGATATAAVAQSRVDQTETETVEPAPVEEETTVAPSEGSGEPAVQGRAREYDAKRRAGREREREHAAKR